MRLFRSCILLIPILISSSNLVFASTDVITLDKFKDQQKYFEQVGKEFKTKEDNHYILDKYGVNNPLMHINAFLLAPDKYACDKDSCPRITIHKDQVFRIESIVSPKFKEAKGFKDNVCDKNVIFCYYKFIFQNSDVAYMQVIDFENSISPDHARVRESPWMLQAIPLKPSLNWNSEKKAYDNYFRKAGVSRGYTKADILNSHWGQPKFKTKSSSYDIDIEIWTYSRGQLSIVDGYVTDITVTQ